jgi:hypothetical protein
MKRTARDLKRLRERALAADIPWDTLPNQFRVPQICRPLGMLAISDRSWRRHVRSKVAPQPIYLGPNTPVWSKPEIVEVALNGLKREPGHGRQLTGLDEAGIGHNDGPPIDDMPPPLAGSSNREDEERKLANPHHVHVGAPPPLAGSSNRGDK